MDNDENKVYYAHTDPAGLSIEQGGRWQTLKEHLKETADIAFLFSSNEKVKMWFKTAGLIHDLGKYQLAFQKYLAEGGRRGSVPHAAWGAGYARNLKMDEMSFAIDGHHKGIPNKADLKIDTEEFRRQEVTEYETVIKKFLEENNVAKNELIPPSLLFQTMAERELFIRWLFSAMTDADWLNTESHFNPELGQYRGIKSLQIDEMIEKLEKSILGKSKEGEINKFRNQVREIVLRNADNPCGFFSLNLPTGMGKTLLSVAWALRHAKANELKRILIVLPYTNIIDQTASVLKEIFGDEWVLEHHSAYNENETSFEDDEYEIDSIKKQKQLACENWDYPIIVTTTVQFFESLFSNKPSKCRKVHSIAESVVIFDEVQTFPKEILLPTLSMLKNVQKMMHVSFLFCTATQPAFEKREMFNGIDKITSLIDNPIEIFAITRRVEYQIMNELKPISQKELMQTASRVDSSVLVIFNTKKAAREFYEAANGLKSWEKSYHLSTAMCPANRQQVIKDIRSDLTNNRKIIVSSTQLIEAGVDFDFPCVMRAVAPLESIVQSAGRCNREGKLPKYGQVFIFQLEGGGMPDRTYQACAEHAKNMIQNDINRLYSHDFFKEYYSQVINLFVDPDKNKIIAAQENLDFETVNNSYRVIREANEGIVIYYYNEESQKLINSIKNERKYLTRDEYRSLQPYTVQVYQNLINSNYDKCFLMPQGIRVWYGGYDHNIGICLEPISADKMMV